MPQRALAKIGPLAELQMIGAGHSGKKAAVARDCDLALEVEGFDELAKGFDVGDEGIEIARMGILGRAFMTMRT